MDLLTEDEERVDRVTGHLRFDIGLLARRLRAATDCMRGRGPERLGYFGASTGAAVALMAAPVSATTLGRWCRGADVPTSRENFWRG
jgi:hypothetical protein